MRPGETAGIVACVSVLAFTEAVSTPQEQPADSVFEQSVLEFVYNIPAAFRSTHLQQGYFPTPVGDVPFRVQTWRSDTDAISVKITVMPEAWWQSASGRQFEQAKAEITRDPRVHVLSDRDYSVSGCAAHSIVFDQRGETDEFRRIDYFLVKPDLRVVMYTSPNEEGVHGAVCKKLFESISIKPKPGR